MEYVENTYPSKIGYIRKQNVLKKYQLEDSSTKIANFKRIISLKIHKKYEFKPTLT